MAPTSGELKAAAESKRFGAILLIGRCQFSDRGFSDRTIESILAFGIDAPERLLFMTEDQLAQIPGIGKVAMKEVRQYRARFLPADGA